MARFFTLVLILLCSAAAEAQSARVALIIANSAYVGGAPVLPNPVADGGLIAASLKTVGFADVVLVTNADRLTMERAIRTFAAKAERADVALVYFAGHGIEYNGENYLIPIDAALANDRDLDIEAVKLSTITGMVEGARRMRIIILDACRTPPAGLRRSAASRSIGRGLAPVEPAGDSLIVYSAKAGTVAADGIGKNSPFASALARRLVEPGREINLLFRQVRDDVLTMTKRVQEPFTYGSLSSEQFYFTAPQLAGQPADLETETWLLCREARSSAPCQAYMRGFPKGRFVELARSRVLDLATVQPVVAAPAAAPQVLFSGLGMQLRLAEEGNHIEVVSVARNSLAYGELLSGDRITAVNGRFTSRSVAISEQLGGIGEGIPMQLSIRRGGANLTIILRQQRGGA